MVIPPTLREWTESTYDHRELQIKLCLRPKPKWLPLWLYHRIVGRLLFLQEETVS